MLDQGSHLIDLSRYFMGEFSKSLGVCGTFFWDMEVEDNCFAILVTEKGKIAQLHASWTQWKNLFRFEIFCEKGLIVIDGLGRSYGAETLTHHNIRPELGPPRIFRFEEEDQSWKLEYEDLIESIEKGKEPSGNIHDARETIKLVHNIYEFGKKFKKGRYSQ